MKTINGDVLSYPSNRGLGISHLTRQDTTQNIRKTHCEKKEIEGDLLALRIFNNQSIEFRPYISNTRENP